MASSRSLVEALARALGAASSAALAAALLLLAAGAPHYALVAYALSALSAAAAAYYVARVGVAAVLVTAAAVGRAGRLWPHPLEAFVITAASPPALALVVRGVAETVERCCAEAARASVEAEPCSCRVGAAALAVPLLLPAALPRAAARLVACLCELWNGLARAPTRLRGKPCAQHLVDVVVWADPLDPPPHLERLLEKRRVDD